MGSEVLKCAYDNCSYLKLEHVPHVRELSKSVGNKKNSTALRTEKMSRYAIDRTERTKTLPANLTHSKALPVKPEYK